MPDPSVQELTAMLLSWRKGDPAALEKLLPSVYKELQRLAHRHMQNERQDHTLQTTALINEVYLRLLDCQNIDWHDRVHFFAVAAGLMRHILVDSARSRRYLKRGGGAEKISLDENRIASNTRDPDLIALDDALTALAAVDLRKSRIVELRYFAGLSVEETAEALGVAPITVMREWRLAKAWLAREMSSASPKRS
jgi:RNA polymerase sigma-70 factor, ECF subfamily